MPSVAARDMSTNTPRVARTTAVPILCTDSDAALALEEDPVLFEDGSDADLNERSMVESRDRFGECSKCDPPCLSVFSGVADTSPSTRGSMAAPLAIAMAPALGWNI